MLQPPSGPRTQVDGATPARVSALPGMTEYGASAPFGVAGDAVAWVEAPPRVGLPRLQARALP